MNLKPAAILCVCLSCIIPLSFVQAADPLSSSIRLQTEVGREASEVVLAETCLME